jgi:MYXO-CTERM domain-containing protein
VKHRRVVAPLAGLLLLGSLGPALAYVRTRTTSGVAIAWPRRCIPFHVNNRGSDNVTLGKVETAARKSFAAWEQVGCSDLELTYQGQTNVEFVGYSPSAQNANMLVFQEDEWPHQSKIIALTTVTFCSAPSGEPCDAAGKVLDADIEMNGVDFIFSASPLPGMVQYDIQNTVTHEAGHFIGLDHTLVENATMFATAPAGERGKQSLEQDDQDGLCEIYPHVTPVPECEPFDVVGDYIVDDPTLGGTGTESGSSDDGGCRTAPGSAGGGALLLATVLATGLRRRRRQGR